MVVVGKEATEYNTGQAKYQASQTTEATKRRIRAEKCGSNC